MSRTLKVSREFSAEPAGRFRTDGPNSGERFREELLIPALKKVEGKLVVDMNDLEGYGSSFLEEAFGGLIRSEFTPKQLHDKLEILADDPALAQEVWSYIDNNRSR